MRKFIISLLIIATVFTAIPFTSLAADAPEITSKNALVIDLATDFSLYEKNADEKVYPGGAVKVMTAILALEKAGDNLDQKITVSSTAIGDIPLSGSKIVEGEEVSVKDLLYSTMLVSANETANALAEFVSGNMDEFVLKMNEKAKELGCNNTNFTNPSGIYDESSYSTAKDIAKITKYAIANEKFLEISAAYTYYIEPTNKNTKRRLLINTNQISSASSAFYIGYAKAIKSATVNEADNSLITLGEKKIGKRSTKILVVLLGCPKSKPVGMSTIYNETKALFEWAYSNFKSVTLIKPNVPITEVNVKLSDGKDFVMLTAKESIDVLIPNDFTEDKLEKIFNLPSEVLAPVEKDQVIGSVILKYNGIEYANVELIAQSSRNRNALLWYSYSLNKFFDNIFVRIISVVLIALLIFYIGVTLYYNNQRKKKKSVRRRIKL
ncbi:MAG: D-alanyl-D-alanine carboxypeptidase family protein [Clostridia bacterium]